MRDDRHALKKKKMNDFLKNLILATFRSLLCIRGFGGHTDVCETNFYSPAGRQVILSYGWQVDSR